MLRCAKIISVDDANANNEKLIRCHAVSFNAGARALSAVKFDGISETHWQKNTRDIMKAYLSPYWPIQVSTIR
jgi:hypothetical protein